VGARLEQKRPLLDSDFNEEAELGALEARSWLLELVGPVGSPNDGFSLGRPLPMQGPAPAQTAALREETGLPVQLVQLGASARSVHALSVRAGSIYVGGQRYELLRPEHIAMQRGFLQMQGSHVPVLEALSSPSPSPFSPSQTSPLSPDASPRSPVSSPASPVVERFPPFRNFYFLRAWEQVVTAVEDEELRDVALGGADTSVRIRRMHRVQVLGNLPSTIADCDRAFAELVRRLETTNAEFDRTTYELKSRGRLQLTFQQDELGDCPECEVSPTARYLGSENQTLRLMLTGPQRFVWANDNSAPLYRVKVTGLSSNNPAQVRVTMLTQPPDEEHQPRRNRVVEILPFGAVLDGAERMTPQDPHFQKIAEEIGAFSRVVEDYDPATKSFTLELGAGTQAMRQFVHEWDPRHPAANQLNHRDPQGSDARYFYMRVWHVAETAADIELPTSARRPLGDTGIIPVFHRAGRRGDFWTATLRVDARDRIVPLDLLSAEQGVAPHGPRHFYAPLALVAGVDQRVTQVSDCRTRMRRANDRACATRSVGDGVTSRGQFSSIQAAIDSLPSAGGIIEIRPGTHLGPVVLRNRKNVVLQGCGQVTLTSGPSSPPAEALLLVEESEGIVLRGLLLQADGQTAVEVRSARHVGIHATRLEAGAVVGGVFQPGAGADDSPVLHAEAVDHLSLDACRIVAGAQSGVSALECSSVILDELEANALGGGAQGLLDLAECSGVRVLGGRFTTEGRVGLRVTGGVRHVVRRSSFESSDYVPTGGSSVPTQPALLVAGVDGFELQHCRVALGHTPSEHAAVVLQGQRIVAEHNTVEAIPTLEGRHGVWGGIQVCGGSRQVTLRNNHITGGVGHGITLGSVAWNGPGDTSVYRGPGFGNVSTVGGVQRVHGNLRSAVNEAGVEYLAEDGGILEDVELRGNSIERMGTNGISSLTVLGLPTSQPLPAVRRLTVDGNVIRQNVQQPLAGMAFDTSLLPFSTHPNTRMDLPLHYLPRGGLVLAIVEGGADIRGNQILGNTPPAGLDLGGVHVPVCGIFVLIGDSLAIADNRVADNGEKLTATTGLPAGIERGVRAGIAVMLAGTATGIDTVPPELRTRSDLHQLLAPGSSLEASGRALSVTRNSVQQPEGRALQVVATGPLAIESNYLSSQGNHKGQGSTERGMIGDVVFVLDLGKPWEMQPNWDGNIVLGNEPPGFASPYFNQQGSPRQFLGFSGALSFVNNQVTYDWDAPGAASPSSPLSFFATAVVSLDHVAVSGNQFAMRVEPASWSHGSGSGVPVSEPFLSDVFVCGATVEAVHNRVSERVGNAYLSLTCVADLMSTMAYNQTTHGVASYRTGEATGYTGRPLRIEVSNQVLYRRFDQTQAVLNSLRGAMRAFRAVGWRTVF
jgi:hypothetical protein